MSNADLSASVMLSNMGLAPNADLNTALTQVFALNPTARGQVIMNLANLLSGLSADATYGAAANAWNATWRKLRPTPAIQRTWCQRLRGQRWRHHL
ncbi:MAG: hypothetical protein IPF55_19360 [Rhodoferax sp.]|nr:hypothetical protein [Rhodoferax sp.]